MNTMLTERMKRGANKMSSLSEKIKRLIDMAIEGEDFTQDPAFREVTRGDVFEYNEKVIGYFIDPRYNKEQAIARIGFLDNQALEEN